MNEFEIGQHLIHPLHGECSVTFVGSDHLGIELADGQQGLVKKEAFLEAPPSEECMRPADIRPSTWPESTFVHENADAQHYPATRWEAFSDDPKTIFERLPDIIQTAESWIGGVNRQPPRSLPDIWTSGEVFAWPNHRQGLMLVISKGEKSQLRNIYPFITNGGQHSLIIRSVNVRENGVEAQIEAELGEAAITFFDIAFAKHRLWYEADKTYEFLLAAIAYRARPAETMEMSVSHNPDEIAWQHNLAEKRGEPVPEAPSIINLRGMALLLPMEGWDSDDYHFRGPVKAIRDVDLDMLGQRGWFVKVTVMRHDDGDVDLDMLITRRAWQGDDPPCVGQDIEGSLCLQGYLWYV